MACDSIVMALWEIAKRLLKNAQQNRLYFANGDLETEKDVKAGVASGVRSQYSIKI